LSGPGQGVRSAARRLLRPPALAVLRAIFRMIDPVLVGWWAARMAPQPGPAAAELSRRLTGLVCPTASDIVGNHLRGLVLFGRPPTYGAGTGFEWCWFPMRAVITPDTAHVPKRLRTLMRRGEYEVRYNQDFETIMLQCQARHGTGWLTDDLISVYREVRDLGFLATIGLYRDGRLVSGMFGIEMGEAFTAMSMFHTEDNTGALVFAQCASEVCAKGRWRYVDFGLQNANFARYGATEMPTQQFLALALRSLGQLAAQDRPLTPAPPPGQPPRPACPERLASPQAAPSR
jgi:leucyl/phenylalanyl-tRNA---protein transferase